MIAAGLLFAVPVIVLAVALVVAAKIYAGAPVRAVSNRDLRQLRRARRSAIRAAQSNTRQGYSMLAGPCWKQADLIDARIAKVMKEIEESAARGRARPDLPQEPPIGRMGSYTPAPTKEHS